MQANFISILNTPNAIRANNIDLVGGAVIATGLAPYRQALTRSCAVRQSQIETPQVWAVAMTAGVANTVSFSVSQNVNGIPSVRTFSFAQTTATTASLLLDQVNGFFGGSATDGGGYVTAAWSAIQYKAAITSTTTLTITIKNAAGYPIASVNEVLNINSVTSAMSTIVLTASAANVIGNPVIFKKVAHGLVSGQLLSVPSSIGQTAAGVVGRVQLIVGDADNFNLVDLQTGKLYLATATTATGAGTLTYVASVPFGTAAFVNADALANDSVQTATVTANNYSLVSIVAGYDNTVTAEASTRVAPIHFWISESADGVATVNWIADNLLA